MTLCVSKYIRNGLFLSVIVTFFIIHFLHSQPPVNILRSFLCFAAAPSLILFGNKRNLWFLSSLRWVLKQSYRLKSSAGAFIFGVLISYEISLILHPALGYPLHLILLFFCSVIYWAPLLIRCSFQISLPYIQKFAYFSLTSILFFIFHEASFYFHQTDSTLSFMSAGLMTMPLFLFDLIIRWEAAEKHTDRETVKGYVKSITEKH